MEHDTSVGEKYLKRGSKFSKELVVIMGPSIFTLIATTGDGLNSWRKRINVYILLLFSLFLSHQFVTYAFFYAFFYPCWAASV